MSFCFEMPSNDGEKVVCFRIKTDNDIRYLRSPYQSRTALLGNLPPLNELS